MISKFTKILVPFLAVVAFVLPFSAKALPNLESSYNLLDFSSHPIVGSSNAFVSVTGHVTPVGNANPSTVHLYFKYQKSNLSGPVYTSTFFFPAASGDFTDTVGTNAQTPFECSQNYTVWLYEENQNAIQVSWQGGAPVPGFNVMIDCAPNAQTGDLYAPDSAGTTSLHGVNWGTVTTTSSAITISGARVIPFIQNGSKNFKIEYGRGTQNAIEEPIGFSSVFTSYPPNYNFNATINVPLPNTSYYFDIWEVAGNTSTALLTRGYATSAKIDGPQNVHYNFSQDNSINIYGNLPGSNALMNFPIDIVIRDANGNDLMTAEETTSGMDILNNGNAYFEHLFFGLSNSGLTVGNTYSIVIRGTNMNADITTPVTFTLPNPNSNQQNNGGQNQAQNPPAGGLIACGADPSNYDCDFNALIDTINKFVNFLIIFVAFPVVAIVIAWAGVLLITSGGSSSKKEHAKSMITHVVIGLAVALLAWAIVKIVLVVFGYVPTGPLWSVLNTTPN